MTNIKEKNIKNDVHSHIDMAYAKIKDRLPENYVAKVFEKLNNDTTLTSGIIRNIKNRNNTYPKSRIKVLIALVEIADEYQLELNKLKEAIK
jgi:FPC/CPF motif-containing protein YcgG